jgi:hypothetical protein
MRYTGDRAGGQFLGLQLLGRLGSEFAKRIDIAATAIFNDMTIDAISDLDLSYTPPRLPVGRPQSGAQAWVAQRLERQWLATRKELW